ncbi:hypothetical protein BAUCODRAFT_375822 [Baudoinia panamericana UAMH 10762]|uniref:Uncharacterized protein n=1 Tax=Baudoinia panamericana (strain UAMH 10762) TaxID=717646 RepID=M2MPF0_BAUPA|nr:uncharacterized protein BAUCODRAFT_375822 [Baudoinia panamericana UAMH 10762]EMC98611.1 hypothetical protein BAUCODRAFT_375822 [Baudoinia panamericana UAMH 10762]
MRDIKDERRACRAWEHERKARTLPRNHAKHAASEDAPGGLCFWWRVGTLGSHAMPHSGYMYYRFLEQHELA